MNLLGNLLIAPPSMRHNFWQKSVILVTEHSDRGSIGVIVNKPTNLSNVDFSRQLGEEHDLPGMVYGGGPVNTKALTLLHSSDWLCENTLRITRDLSLSSHRDLLKLLAIGNSPRCWRLVLGLCVWNPGQLESEIEGKHGYEHNQSWLLASSDLHAIFGADGVDLWTLSIERSSSEFVQKILA
ncbi:MAG: hypothetical protein EBT24_12670 [Betaproteobacteria bacterium]|nr:hypothetical protein [Betaproteobacteria bacterium]